MLIKNTTKQYGLIAILIHWIMAIFIIGLLAVGLYMVRLPIGLWKLKLYGYHKEFGALVFLLILLRILWKLVNAAPTLPDHMPNWQKTAARSVHHALYIVVFFMPITGWLTSSAAGLSVSFFGLFTLPDLISANPIWEENLALAHEVLGFTLIGLLGLHVGAVFQHYLVFKDNLLRRMWP
ncbi:cytochrome b [Legionella waltersii]|uniref:Cytochrome b561 transmembrane protein n=1 Tax=Legionella waltersii TaxID=66969 RepID=A0A0W1ABX8_9GAMM|nr:cytochrome b [Legionella waltersii]KTD78825.1 cytochrome b561 transmembrane protein [Legionella waltersii]SNV10949.1 cytochrome b561 transmembrane protein [Legionella waltersii]